VSKPKVSILIPTYNRENLIRETVESALKQTFDDYEIVIIDNKSTDATYEVVKEYADNNKKIKVFQNEKNLGPVGNWKAALFKSRGKYIKFLWSDDLIDERFLEKTVPVLEKNNDIGFVYTKTEIFSTNYRKEFYKFGETKKYSNNIFIEGALTGKYVVPVSPGCALFRKKDTLIIDNIPNGFDIDHSKTGAGIDLLMFLEIADKYSSFYFINEILSFFRSHEESFTIANDLSREYYTAKAYFLEKYGYWQFKENLNSLIFLKEIKIEASNIFRRKEILNKYFKNNNSYSLSYFFIVRRLLNKVLNKFSIE